MNGLTSSSSGGNVPRVGIQDWLFSFSDMLTLLLAFFLYLIALSPIGPGSERRPTNPLSDGIPLAEGKVPVEVQRVVGAGPEAITAHQELSAETLEAVKNVVSLSGYRLSEMVVESCAPLPQSGNTDAQEVSWFVSLSRTQAIRRQLIDALGVEAATVSVRPVGQWCSALSVEQSGAVEVAVVTRFGLCTDSKCE